MSSGSNRIPIIGELIVFVAVISLLALAYELLTSKVTTKDVGSITVTSGPAEKIVLTDSEITFAEPAQTSDKEVEMVIVNIPRSYLKNTDLEVMGKMLFRPANVRECRAYIEHRLNKGDSSSEIFPVKCAGTKSKEYFLTITFAEGETRNILGMIRAFQAKDGRFNTYLAIHGTE